MDRDALKREAAGQAADLIKDGMIVGLGTGSTAAAFIDHLIARKPDILCIPTSERSAEQAKKGGLKLTDFAHHTSIDICVDGADEIKRDTLALVKGLGGALLREKLVASAARRLIIIADSEKLVDWLGTKSPIPVEVTQFAWELTASRLNALAESTTLRITQSNTPYITDGGNYIIDCAFGAIANAEGLDRQLREIVGVVETGLFINMAEMALVAGPEGVARFLPK